MRGKVREDEGDASIIEFLPIVDVLYPLQLLSEDAEVRLEQALLPLLLHLLEAA